MYVQTGDLKSKFFIHLLSQESFIMLSTDMGMGKIININITHKLIILFQKNPNPMGEPNTNM